VKVLFLSLLAAAAPAVALAQSAAPASTTPAKAAVAAKSKAATPARKGASEARSADEPDPRVQLNDNDLAVARRVHTGEIPCELGAKVNVTPLGREGFFRVVARGVSFLMHPVESRTGAIRLEDTARGAVWLQLGNKSMLMSHKLGQRLADECQSPAQVTFAEDLKKRPPVNLLEPEPAAAPSPGDAPKPGAN